MSQKQSPTFSLSPLLRNGGKAVQSVAHDSDGCDELLTIFVLQTDSDRALTAMPDQPGDSSEQSGPAGDCLTMMLGIVETHVEVPPVVDERDQIGHQPTGAELSRGEAIPTPLVLEFIVDVLRVRSLTV